MTMTPEQRALTKWVILLAPAAAEEIRCIRNGGPGTITRTLLYVLKPQTRAGRFAVYMLPSTLASWLAVHLLGRAVSEAITEVTR